jgi:CRISPR-associated protein Csb2
VSAAADLRITLRFLQPYTHGRGEDGMPEWPPSPLRMFQALVATGLGREVFDDRRVASVAALRALERAPAPEIFAPAVANVSAPIRLFVPDNAGDRAARSWSAGRDADLSEYRTEKDVRPLTLDGEAVHYVFRAPELSAHVSCIQRVARSVTHLGWGIDMVVGDAQPSAEMLEGERWIPGRHGATTLRLPVDGTLNALELKHAQFLQRLDGGTLRPVPPLTVFGTEPYARATDTAQRAFLAFRLLEPLTGDGLWFEPTRRSRDIAAWIRHAVGDISAGWPFGSTETIVHGHRQQTETSGGARPRFSYLPLPTINPRLGRVEGIRRVLVMAPNELAEHLAWVGKHLGGEVLEWQGQPMAVLEPLPPTDWVLRQYVGRSASWTTVTPVVLPGHDDGSSTKAEAHLRKAFLHAGFEPEVLDKIEQLQWRKVGFAPGTEHASRYLHPDKVNGPMFHVRVRFAAPVIGPFAIGSGRHRGLGVFVGSQTSDE